MKRIKTMLEKNINRVISMLMILILTMGLIGTNYRDVNAATIHTINNSLLDTVKSVSNVKLNSSTLADYEWKKGIDGKKEGDRFYLPIKSMQTSFSYDSPLKLYFENVMTINGRNINAQMSIDRVDVSIPYGIGGEEDGTMIFFGVGATGIWVGSGNANEPGKYRGLKNTKITTEFTYADTGKDIDVPLYQILTDIDVADQGANYKEAWQGNSGYTGDIFVFENCEIDIDRNNMKLTATNGTDGDDQWLKSGAIVPISGSRTTQTYSAALAATGLTFYCPYDENNLTTPTKEVDSSSPYIDGDTISWKINQKIHIWQADLFTVYKNFAIEDVLPDDVKYLDATLLHNGSDVTERFGQVSYDETTKKVTYTFNSNALNNISFYDGSTYTLEINTRAINNTSDILIDTNSATTNISKVIQKSNEVNATINPHFRINTEIVNGKITDSIPRVELGENKVINWQPNDGYYIAKVTVDEENYPLVNSQSFSNISANHSVSVACNPYHKITTEIDHGVITEDDLQIKDNENRTVSFIPESGYYVSKVTIDNEVKYESNKISGYPAEEVFNNITKDHDVKVETKKIPALAITKISDKKKYNIDEEITYTITVKQTIEGAKATNVIISDKDKTEGLALNLDSITCTREDATVSKGNNTFTVHLDSLEYGEEVVITVKGKVTKDELNTSDVKNTASVGSDQTEETTDENEIEINYSIITNVINGTIDDDIYGIRNGENKKISYQPKDGYYLAEIKVDGKNIDPNKYENDYTFTNIKDNHLIEVVYANFFKVTTEIDHGTITEDKFDIKSGEDHTVVWKPAEGYYVSKVTVDDVEIYTGNVTSGYPIDVSFTDISENHDVKVETKLIPNLVIDKETDKTEYKAGDIITFTIKAQQTVEGAEATNVVIADTDVTEGLVINLDSINCNLDTATIDLKNNGFVVNIPFVTTEKIEITFTASVDTTVLKQADIVNVATIKSEQTEEISDDARAGIYYTITTSVENGTIDKSIQKIPFGESRTITYKADEGYRIASITVDGIGIEVTDENKFEFMFDKISANHDIKVVYEKVPEETSENVTEETTKNEETTTSKEVKGNSSMTSPKTGNFRSFMTIFILLGAAVVIGILSGWKYKECK